MSKEIGDVIVVGGGPKGLSTAMALQDAGVKETKVVEFCGPGRSWWSDRMNPRLTLDPRGWEITIIPGLSFQDFWDNAYPDRKKRESPLHHGAFTAEHFRSYLKWLAKKVNVGIGNVVEISRVNDVLRVGLVNRDGVQESLATRAVVLATGLIGYGGTEFLHDPTGLRKISPRVKHTPGDIRTDHEVAKFIGGARVIAVIGGAGAGSGTFWHFKKIPEIEIIHFITSSNIENQPEGKLSYDNKGRLISQIPPYNYELMVTDKRVVFHPNTTIIGATDVGDKVVLATDSGGLIEAERVILATGYRYNFSRLPFGQDLVEQGLVSLTGRYPNLTEDHKIQGDKNNVLIYVIGEGALQLGADQRFLASTACTVGKICESVQQELGRCWIS